MADTPIGAPTDPIPVNLTVTQQFLAFLKEYGVIGLAIAVVIGGKLNALVTSIVSDLLMPLVFQPLLQAAHVEDIRSLQIGGIFYGRVIGAAIDFLIVAIVVFFIAKKILKEQVVKKK
ncbi:MAG: large conductance mechanosensitive channel protein MscL [Proteobacteria bacterium]|nr:MAG: large conductance mechanosensitive channel protein MscL [Pseudomonadota bacterium]RYZ68928.1 MAG: large conductance mechanosensitive channel protein MscL [Pseudomonadota bacterium]